MQRLASTRPRLLIGCVTLVMMAGCAGRSQSGSTAGAAQAPKGNGVIKIGALLPLSGDNANAGIDALNAAKIAADELNAGGGVLGRSVEIVPGDDGCDPQTGTAAAQKLLVSGVVAVAGGYCSGAAIPETTVLDSKGVPFVSAAATNPLLTERGLPTVFRTVGRDDQQGPFAARFLAGSVGARKLAILHDNTTYAKGLAEETRTANTALKLGMQIVFFDAITP
ncbi:MAG TPA: branched-chain amino acid ABC transporter substrate-binding protein, partial [Acidimicrobiia bacterium]|nr:branched-chain amino acid ABC transporter substrate-binding protein [Acidimicrobiia bacterium]